MEKVKILFKNGTEINAEKNGNSLITENRPDFPIDLSFVKVVGNGTECTYKNAEIIKCASIDGRFWFAFREIPETERASRQMQANIEYIAMMTDVDLEEA